MFAFYVLFHLFLTFTQVFGDQYSTDIILAPNLTQCVWEKKDNQMEVYWINLDRSKNKRKAMEELWNRMGLKQHRVQAISNKELYIPKDILHSLDHTGQCIPFSNFDPTSIDENHQNLTSPEIQPNNTRKLYLKGACGSPSNSFKEMAVVASHLFAIRQAIYSEDSNSKYALITEDDVWTPYDIDFQEMVNTLPSQDFGILQILNPKSRTPLHQLDKIDNSKAPSVRAASSGWWQPLSPDLDSRFLPSPTTIAYIVNRQVMKPIIEQLVSETPNGWLGFKVVAGNSFPVCKPSFCCAENSSIFQFQLPECVLAPNGFQADSFIYALSKTSLFTFPLFFNEPGIQSLVPPQRVVAFESNLKKSQSNIPYFVKKACPF